LNFKKFKFISYKRRLTAMLHYVQDKKRSLSEGVNHSKYYTHSLKNIKKTHDKCQFVEDEAYIKGFHVDTDSFESYISSMWSLMNQARHDPRFPEDLRALLLKGMNGAVIHSPSYLESTAELIHKMDFNPACLSKVEYFPNVDVPKLPKFGAPPVTPMLIVAGLRCQARYPQFNQSFVRSMFVKHGFPAYNISGRSARAYEKQVAKLTSNIVSPEGQWAPDLHLAMLKLLRKWGVKKFSLKFKLDYKLMGKLLNKNTSIGYIPAQFLEVVDGAVKNATGLKKKDVIAIVMKMFEEYISAIEEWVAGEREGSMPMISIVDIEMLKYEVIWNHDMMEDHDVTPEQMEENLTKVRLFYMSSVMDYILSVLCYKPISESVRFYESAIGVKVEAGGLQRIWEILHNSQWTDRQQELIDKWIKRDGTDLTDMLWGQGDWKRYDQTLLALVLLFVALFAKPFFVWSEDSGMSPETMKVLYDQFVISVVQKVMFLYAHGTYEAFGCMFSGKFITSIGDTIYQMLLKMLYFMQLLKKYPNSELLRDIIEGGFVIFFFYGDDHLGRWPRVMHRFYLYTNESTLKDFIEFCCQTFGMIHKTSEFKVCPNIYGERYFYYDKGVFVEDLTRAVDSPIFLKNTVVRVYLLLEDQEDYVFIGNFPYRDTRDIAAKLLLTVKSSGNVKTAAMSMMSFARLCSGNPEAYSMVKVMYDEIALLAGEITYEEWDYFKNSVGENSARRAMKTGGFPSYDVLLLEQNVGKDTVGFEPKDFLGRPSPKSCLYSDNGQALPT